MQDQRLSFPGGSMVDIGRAIRLAVDTGRVKFGSRDAVKAALNGEAKLIVLASNCPQRTRGDIEYYSKLSKIATLEFSGTSLELGSVCGKPFPVAALSIYDVGTSNIEEAVKGK